MKMFKVHGVYSDVFQTTGEYGFKEGHIFIAGESETDIRYQINKYGLIAIDKIEEYTYPEITRKIIRQNNADKQR